MRATLTLDGDIAAELKELADDSDKPFKTVVNETLRRGLCLGERPVSAEPFVVEPFESELQPGIDPRRLNQALDDLALDDFAAKVAEANETTGATGAHRRTPSR